MTHYDDGDEPIREVGHDTDGGAIWQGSLSGERWNAGNDHECGLSALEDYIQSAMNDPDWWEEQEIFSAPVIPEIPQPEPRVRYWLYANDSEDFLSEGTLLSQSDELEILEQLYWTDIEAGNVSIWDDEKRDWV